ncbi:MAG: ABC-F family ATP-binding cassette domain-containing protein [Ruminococcaceae bacterium]|nr:ABC-F family ATP-binding cassette domain-containing protein [Oscillospiraceae bacterium]
MIILNATELSLHFGATTILENVSFSINEGDRLGIIGVNGAGKTSLFRIITGEYTPDTGAVYISKDKTIGVLEQNANFEGEEVLETVLEHMFLAYPELMKMEQRLNEIFYNLSHRTDHESASYVSLSNEYGEVLEKFTAEGGMYFKGKCQSILEKMGFDLATIEQPVFKLSGGQRTRLELARLLAMEPDILMLDEPTNHLDVETIYWLESFLTSYKKTVIVISHDRYFLDNVTNKILHIERHSAKLYNGNYSTAQKLREENREAEAKRYDIQQKEIARVEAMIEQQRRWGQEKNFVTIRAKENYLKHMDKVEKPEDELKSIRLSFQSAPAGGNDVIIADDLSMRFLGKTIFEKVSFLIKKGEKVFFTGPNGCGKSTLMKIIVDKLVPTTGTVQLGANIKAAYYDQENQNLNESSTVLEELWDAYPTLTEYDIRSTLALFLFKYDDTEKRVSDLSGGERARLTLAKLILSKVNLLVLDEPTNHLDIPSREALENALSAFGGTIVCVSHDRYFIEKLATRIIEILPRDFATSTFVFTPSSGENVYESYRAQRELLFSPAAALEADSGEVKQSSTSKEEYLQKKKEAADKRKNERQQAAYLKEIEELEAELVTVIDELYGEAASDYIRAAELDDRKTIIEDRLLQLYELTE